MKKIKATRLAEAGPVLSTRERGREAADRIQSDLTDHGVVVSFADVEIATPSFLDEVVSRLAGLLHGNEKLTVVLTGLNEEVRHSLQLVLERRHLRLTVLGEDEKVHLLNSNPQLEETLAKAQELGTFTASELAKELKLKLPNLHQRLTMLLEAGALTREPDSAAGRRGHSYSATKPADINPKKLVTA